MDQKQHLLDELATIEENALYTSQAHFVLAARKNQQVRTVLLVGSSVSAISGILVAFGCSPKLGAIPVICGLVTGVMTAFGVEKEANHIANAANSLTSLRQEARALRETFSIPLSPEELTIEVRRVSERYQTLIQALPQTDTASFEEARTRIKAGRFEADFRLKDKS